MKCKIILFSIQFSTSITLIHRTIAKEAETHVNPRLPIIINNGCDHTKLSIVFNRSVAKMKLNF